jgi:hypothetical protein
MNVTAPPRLPASTPPPDLEALIKEARRRARRRWAIYGALTLVALALAGGIGFFVSRGGGNPPSARDGSRNGPNPGAPGSSATSPALSFTGPRTFATGLTPQSVAIGDLNGDHKPDLATANVTWGTVSVFLTRGGGRFQAKLDYPTDASPTSIAIGDLNGDGKLDLATANSGAGTISVLLNKGSGSFQAKLDYLTGDEPSSIAIGDLNGDGKPDLAVANGGGGRGSTASVLLNRDEGGFAARQDYPTGGAGSIAIGDLNGDGKLDLATANSGAGTVSVLLNKGRGSFQAKVDYPVGGVLNSLAIGDLTGDGKPDLATANQFGSNVSVLANRGDGTFEARRNYATGRSPFAVAIGDLNGDGKQDLVTAGGVSVLLNRGDGRFGSRRSYQTELLAWSVALGDLNGDRKLDVATTDGSFHLGVLLNTTGLCTVPNVAGKSLPVATRAFARASCRVGKIRLTNSKLVTKGRVISERPKPGVVLPRGGMISLVVSRGRK